MAQLEKSLKQLNTTELTDWLTSNLKDSIKDIDQVIQLIAKHNVNGAQIVQSTDENLLNKIGIDPQISKQIFDILTQNFAKDFSIKTVSSKTTDITDNTVKTGQKDNIDDITKDISNISIKPNASISNPSEVSNTNQANQQSVKPAPIKTPMVQQAPEAKVDSQPPANNPAAPGPGVRRPFDGLSFLEESNIKKQYYNRIPSITELKEEDVDNIIPNNTDHPHFVLTLNNLDDLSINDDIDTKDNNAEITELERLQQCIKSDNIQSDPRIDLIKQKLGNVYNVSPDKVILTDIYYGTTNIGYYIWDYTRDAVKEIVKNVNTFIARMRITFQQFKNLILTERIPDSTDGSYEIVRSYHVSCASKKCCSIWNCNLSQHNLGGIVLYSKDGQTDWYCNGRHCKIGYIIIKPSAEVTRSHPSNYGIVHGSTYKSVFNEEPRNIVGSGFARVNGVWKWNSGSFNAINDEWHNSQEGYSSRGTGNCAVKSMNEIEQKWIKQAVEKWHQNGIQNTMVTESLVIFKD